MADDSEEPLLHAGLPAQEAMERLLRLDPQLADESTESPRIDVHGRSITCDDLKRAARIVETTTSDDLSDLGFEPGAIDAFLDDEAFTYVDDRGPEIKLDPMALLMGLSIGAVAARLAGGSTPKPS